MPALIQCLKRMIGACLALACAQAAQAQEAPNLVVVRFTGARPSAELDRHVASETLASERRVVEGSAAAEMTFRTFVATECGSFRSAYFAELVRLNEGSIIRPDQIVGAREVLRTPTCLYVRTLDGDESVRTNVVSPGALFEQLTGRDATLIEQAQFFRTAPQNLESWPGPGELSPSYQSASVELRIRGDVETFMANLRRLAGADLLIIREPAVGEIILALTPEVDRCTPFAANAGLAEIENALARAVARGESRDVDVLVVDNGFFGADPRRNAGEEFVDSPFERALFPRGNDTLLPYTLEQDTPSYAANYSNNLSPSEVASHGTHVTGVILGAGLVTSAGQDAPAATPQQLFFNGADPWLSVRFLNVARGRAALLKGAHRQIGHTLNNFHDGAVVNMSLSYNGRHHRQMHGDFAQLFDQRRNALFVVAAGNATAESAATNVRDSEIYPAALGGGSYRNVITVAAVHSDNRLAPFSNYGEGVDIAAPGCRISSWTANSTSSRAPQSGTSSATPAVSLAAVLLQHTSSEFTPDEVRIRLIVSGDLLHRDFLASTAFGVSLNTVKALYWADDLVAISREGLYRAGALSETRRLQCEGQPREIRLADLWSIKRDQDSFWLYAGRAGATVTPPCRVNMAINPQIVFATTSVVDANGRETSQPEAARVLALSDIDEVVQRPRWASGSN